MSQLVGGSHHEREPHRPPATSRSKLCVQDRATTQETSGGDLFVNPAFGAALTEIQSLGFRVSPEPFLGATEYGVIAGRSNPRWWLVPLANRGAALSGLALFQPVLTSARLLKAAAVAASAVGLPWIWARRRIYIGGPSCLADVFRDGSLQYAFFTGTDCPHRKVAVQVMDGDGRLKGFAKVAGSLSVKPLLEHEAATLDLLHRMSLESALIPAVLHSAELGGVRVLVTDTRKTRLARTAKSLGQAHIAFVRELAAKAARQPTGCVVPPRLVAELQRALPPDWRFRLAATTEALRDRGGALLPVALGHGDFTPWNTFFVGGRLYVFDWEYSTPCIPVGHDLLHFVLSLPATRSAPAAKTLERARKILRELGLAANDFVANVRILDYLYRLTTRYVSREARVTVAAAAWPGADTASVLLDALLPRVSR